MEGVTILNSTEIMKLPESVLPIAFGIPIVIILIFLIISVFTYDDGYFILGLLLGILSFVICSTICSNNKIGTGKYEYQVIVSEDVNFVEFHDKYEILKQDGEIYTVKEKE